MKPSNFHYDYFLNSFYPNIMRGIRIQKNFWPIKHYPDNPKQKKKQTLCLKEYKRLKKREYYTWTASYRRIRKSLHKMLFSKNNPLYREEQMIGKFYQPPYEQIKWNLIDFPDKIKEYFLALAAIQAPVMPVITTDMPPAYNFDELEQSYLSYLKNKNKDRELSPIEAAIISKLTRIRENPLGIIRFANGNEMLVPYPTPEDGEGLHRPNFWIDEETNDE